MKNIILLLLFFIAEQTYGQVIITDTSVTMEHSAIHYVPRIGLSYQENFLIEFGICRQWSGRSDSYSKNLGYGKDGAAYIGTYLSGETVLKHEDRIYGIKLGAETFLLGGSYGMVLGLEATDYIYQTRHYLGVTPKLIIPFTKEATPLGFLSYGYCINDFNSLSSTIGNHRFSLIINLCVNEHTRINKMHKDFRDGVTRIKTNGS